jgi:osmotically-inducible protein OsmY
MNPMESTYLGARGWEPRTPLFGPHGEYIQAGERFGHGYRYGLHEPGMEQDHEWYASSRQTNEHSWRGGMLGWLGSGLRASAAWVGGQMQRWGALLGGKLQGTGEEIGEAMRARGERMGSAMEQRGEARPDRFRGWHGRAPRSYRRPDDRILDEVHQRIATSGVDAEDVEIEVNNGIVTLSGRVPRHFDKRLIEEITEQVFGVEEVQNHLRLARGVEPKASSDVEPGRPGAENGHGPATAPL